MPCDALLRVPEVRPLGKLVRVHISVTVQSQLVKGAYSSGEREQFGLDVLALSTDSVSALKWF